jgi:hypothetical protein
MSNFNSQWAKKLRLKLTFEKIQLVRRERSRKARGDILLMSAQKSLKFNCTSSARQDLESFLSIVKDLAPEHKYILEAECKRLLPCWNSRDGPKIVEIIILIVQLLLLLIRDIP